MDDRVRHIIKKIYQEEADRIKVSAFPVEREAAAERIKIKTRSAGAKWFYAAAVACILVLLGGLALTGGRSSMLAVVITEKGRTNEWDTRLEAEYKKIPQAFYDAFAKHF